MSGSKYRELGPIITRLKNESPDSRLKLIQNTETGFEAGDIVTYRKGSLAGDARDPSMGAIRGHDAIPGCKVIGFTPANLVRIEIPHGIMQNGKIVKTIWEETRVEPRNLERTRRPKKRK